MTVSLADRESITLTPFEMIEMIYQEVTGEMSCLLEFPPESFGFQLLKDIYESIERPEPWKLIFMNELFVNYAGSEEFEPQFSLTAYSEWYKKLLAKGDLAIYPTLEVFNDPVGYGFEGKLEEYRKRIATIKVLWYEQEGNFLGISRQEYEERQRKKEAEKRAKANTSDGCPAGIELSKLLEVFNVDGPYYSEELAIALRVWLRWQKEGNQYSSRARNGTPKEQLLELASEYQDKNGQKFGPTALNRIATVANWSKDGSKK